MFGNFSFPQGPICPKLEGTPSAGSERSVLGALLTSVSQATDLLASHSNMKGRAGLNPQGASFNSEILGEGK